MTANQSPSTPHVVAVVVNYRSADETLRCVEALKRVDHSRLDIVIVDNDSQNGAIERLRAESGVEVIESPRNLGYGDGANQGIQRASQLGADLIWIVSPDVRVRPDSLAPLVELMCNDRRIGASGPAIRAGTGWIVQSTVNRKLGYYPAHRLVDDAELATLPASLPTDYVDGCAILLRKQMLDEIGLFRTDFFLYFDETELCLRAADSGWKLAIVPAARVETRSISENRNNRDFYMIRNSILLARIRRRYVARAVIRHVVCCGAGFVSGGRLCERTPLRLTARAIVDGLRAPIAPVDAP